MKKIIGISVLCFCFISSSNAQQLWIFAEGQTTQPLKKVQVSEIKNNYYAWQWVALTGKKGNGFYFQTSQEPETNTFALGYTMSKTYGFNSLYAEAGLAPGLEWNTGDPDIQLSGSGYICFETKPDEKRSVGKWNGIVNSYYSKKFGSWWQGNIMYSPVKWGSIGFFFQSGSAIGPRIELNLPSGFTPWITIGLGNSATTGRLTTIGLSWNTSIDVNK